MSMMQYGTYVRRTRCFPCRTAVEALRILLARAHLDVVVNALDQDTVWDKMKDPQQHTTGVTLLSRYAA